MNRFQFAFVMHVVQAKTIRTINSNDLVPCRLVLNRCFTFNHSTLNMIRESESPFELLSGQKTASGEVLQNQSVQKGRHLDRQVVQSQKTKAELCSKLPLSGNEQNVQCSGHCLFKSLFLLSQVLFLFHPCSLFTSLVLLRKKSFCRRKSHSLNLDAV